LGSKVATPPADSSASGEAGAKRFYPELESVRGVAALTVVLFHVFGTREPNPQTLSNLDFEATANLVLTTVFGGTGAVTVFFVLSGFVLGESLNRFPALSVRAYSEYFVKRLFRLLPAAWASIALAIILMILQGAPVRWGLLGQALALREQVLPHFNGPLWSLYVELYASAAFPILVFANRLLSPPFQLVILYCLLWISAANGFPFWTVFFFCFQFGLMIRSVMIPVIESMPSGMSFLLFFVSLIGILAPTNLHHLGFIGTKDHTHIEGLAATFLLAYVLTPQGAWLSEALKIAPFRFLGRISYSLYAFHFPITSALENWTWRHLVSQPYLVAQGVCLLTVVPACIAAGYLGYRFIEEPWRKFGRDIARIFRRQDGEAPLAY
jgi:peptidoglycan/LPS O-acetylase OafA/YrhL